jgi:hypothetical protein
VIRTVAMIPRLFVYQGETAIIARGTPDQVMLAEWLVEQLDRTGAPTDTEFRMPRADDAVRLFHVSKAVSQQQLQEVAFKVRTGAGIRSLLTYSPSKVIAARGTNAQLEHAARLIAASSK